MHKAKLKNASIYWREDGDPKGPSVVFANSLGTDLRLWDKVIPRMPTNLRLLRFDKRGHGLSSCPDGPYSIQDHANDVAEFLDQMGIKNCVFIGLSIGGMIGLKLASVRPDLVRALVLSNSAAKMGDAQMWQDRIAALRTGGIEVLTEPFMERWFSGSYRKSHELSAWRAMLAQTPLAGYIACCQAIAEADLTGSTKKLTIPVLGIGGSEDLACPSAVVLHTTEMVAGSRFEEIVGVGHLPCVEKPETFATLVTDFIKDLGNV